MRQSPEDAERHRPRPLPWGRGMIALHRLGEVMGSALPRFGIGLCQGRDFFAAAKMGCPHQLAYGVFKSLHPRPRQAFAVAGGPAASLSWAFALIATSGHQPWALQEAGAWRWSPSSKAVSLRRVGRGTLRKMTHSASARSADLTTPIGGYTSYRVRTRIHSNSLARAVFLESFGYQAQTRIKPFYSLHD